MDRGRAVDRPERRRRRAGRVLPGPLPPRRADPRLLPRRRAPGRSGRAWGGDAAAVAERLDGLVPHDEARGRGRRAGGAGGVGPIRPRRRGHGAVSPGDRLRPPQRLPDGLPELPGVGLADRLGVDGGGLQGGGLPAADAGPGCGGAATGPTPSATSGPCPKRAGPMGSVLEPKHQLIGQPLTDGRDAHPVTAGRGPLERLVRRGFRGSRSGTLVHCPGQPPRRPDGKHRAVDCGIMAISSSSRCRRSAAAPAIPAHPTRPRAARRVLGLALAEARGLRAAASIRPPPLHTE